MTKPDRDAAELEVLDRLEARFFSLASEDGRHTPAYFTSLLLFTPEDTPAHLAALKRLLARDILRIVSARGTWSLAAVSGRPARELMRLRAELSDPKAYLQRLAKELRVVVAAINSGQPVSPAELTRGGEILGEVLAVLERLGRNQDEEER